jgi:hypothetical protein
LMDGVTFQSVKVFPNSFTVTVWEIFSMNNPFLLSVVYTDAASVSFTWTNHKFDYIYDSSGEFECHPAKLDSHYRTCELLNIEILFPIQPRTENWPRLQWVNPWQKIQILTVWTLSTTLF